MKKWFFILLMMVGMAVPGFSQATEHVVKVGETFASIAQKYGMTEQQLKEANPKYKGVFFVGMKFNIPQKYANSSADAPQTQPSPEPKAPETAAPKQTVTNPQTSNPKYKNYEGDTDKEGRPDGYGTMYFEPKYGNIAYTEKLEGLWKKGVPVSGKAYRHFKENGKPRMKFEGEFKLKKKGVLNYLEDLKLKGNMVFYSYNEDSEYQTRGNQVFWGYYDGKIKNGYYLATKTKQMGTIRNGEYGRLGKNGALTAEAQKYYNEISPLGSAWIFDRKPEFERIHVVRKKDSFIKLNNIYWSGSIKNGLLDGKGSGSVSTTLDKNNTVQYSIEGEFREGAPLNVRIYRILLHKALVNNMWTHNKWVTEKVDESTVEVTTGELRNNLRPFRVDRIRGSSYWREDTSYEGYVDENFKFKSDYAEEAKKEQIEKENQAWGALFNAVGAAVGGTINVLNKLAPDTPSKSYDTGSIEIDWDNCKEPSVELEIIPCFFDCEWESEEPGVIAFKNSSNKYKYKIRCHPDKTFRFYEVKGPYAQGFYKTKEEMMKAIVEAEQRYR